MAKENNVETQVLCETLSGCVNMISPWVTVITAAATIIGILVFVLLGYFKWSEKIKKFVKKVNEIYSRLDKIDAIHNELTTTNNGTIKQHSNEIHTQLTDPTVDTIKQQSKAIHDQLTVPTGDTIRKETDETHRQTGRVNDIYKQLTDSRQGTIRQKTETIHHELTSTDAVDGKETIKNKVCNIKKQLTDKTGETLRKDIEAILNKP